MSNTLRFIIAILIIDMIIGDLFFHLDDDIESDDDIIIMVNTIKLFNRVEKIKQYSVMIKNLLYF